MDNVGFSSQNQVNNLNQTTKSTQKTDFGQIGKLVQKSALGTNDYLSIQTFVGSPEKTKTQKALRTVKEDMAKVVLEIGKIPFVKPIAYKLYGVISKPDGDKDDKPMGNLGNLNPNLIRGSQPLETDFIKLKATGVKTIINLRPEANWEKGIIDNLGMKEIYLPLPAIGKPSNKQALDFLSAATDSQNGKVFFHCLHGADRTGAMAAAYRISVDGWSADKAIGEMYKYNFHDGFEDAKIDFVKDFADYWKNLPDTTKKSVLHQV